MKKGSYLNTILRSNKTVFTLKDLALLWQEKNTNAAQVRLNYYVNQGDLFRIRRGIYVKDKNYNKLELASRIFTPSYVSFETVLAQEGLIFQYQTAITVASYLTRDITVDGQNYSYKKMKDTILINQSGIQQANHIAIATKERALLDTLYNKADFYFDNLRSIDWQTVSFLVPIYNNKSLTKRIRWLSQNSKKALL